MRNHHRVYHKDQYTQLLEKRKLAKRVCPVEGCRKVFRCVRRAETARDEARLGGDQLGVAPLNCFE